MAWAAVLAPMLVAANAHAAVQADVQGNHLRGTVADAEGAAVGNAEVIVFREGATIAHRRTDAAGEFSFDGVAQEYQVIVRAPGFQELRSGPVPFAVGSLSRFTLQMAAPQSDTEIPPASAPRPAALNETPVKAATATPGWEYGVVAQGGIGTEDRSDYRFLLLGGHAGKQLTPDVGSGLLRGNFEYAVEVFPLWQSYTPRFQKVSCSYLTGSSTLYRCSQPYTVGGTYTGVSVTPIILRWNFTHAARWMPWLQGAGGVVWTNHKYPAIGNTNTADIASNGPSGDTSVWNFTPQFGVGTHYFLRQRQSLDFGANAVHISSASLGDKNPGVNASVQFSVGYSWWK